MFPGEGRSRLVIKKIIEETKVGNIRWFEGTGLSEGTYSAEWRHWRIVASYPQDQAHIWMARGDRHVGMSYWVMEGLRETILDQIDPLWREHDEENLRRLRADAARLKKESDQLIEEFLTRS